MTGINFQSVNSYNNYPQLKQDIEQVKGAVNQVETVDKKVADMALGSISPLRRITSLPDKFKNNEYMAALGLTGLALINLPEDCRDLQKSIQQVNNKFLSENAKTYMEKNHKKVYEKFVKYDPIYNRNKYQHGFSFFRGTMLEKFVDPNKAKNKKLASKLLKNDITLLDSKFGQAIQKRLGVEEAGCIDTKIKDIGYTKTNKLHITASSFKGGSKFGRLTAKAMHRIPVLSIAALALLELPKIFKSTKKGDTAIQKADEVTKQTVKSGINVASILAGIGYAGAAGHKYLGPIGSLIGMGVGAVVGATASKKIQEVIG